jgi:hypothetical protein
VLAGCAAVLLGLAPSAFAAGAWFEPFPFASTQTTQFGEDPFVAVAPDGTIHVTYRDGSGNSPVPGRVAVRTRRPDGSLSPDLQLVQPGVNNNSGHGLTVAPSGVATVLWRDNMGLDLLLRRVSATGALDPVTHQIDEPGVNFGQTSALAGDRAGNSYVAYVPNLVRFRAVSAEGVKGPELILSPEGDAPSGDPSITVAPDGTVLVAWADEDADLIRLRTVSPAGVVGSPEIAATGTNAFAPQLAVDDAGRAYVAWSGDGQATLRVRQPDGSYGPAEVVSPPDAVPAGNVGVGVGADGAAAVIWRQGSDPQRILGRRRSADGAYGPVVPIEEGESGAFAQSPQVVVESGGIAVVGWQRLAGGIFTAHARGFRADSSLDPAIELSSGTGDFFIGGDGVGNTAVATVETTSRVDLRLGDFGGPEQRSLLAPATVERGVAATWSFAPFDRLSSVAGSRWEFSDGSATDGAAVTRSFAAVGDFVARSITSDSVGNVRSVAHPFGVRDTTRPAISGLRLSRKRFRAGRRAIPRSAARARAGTTLRYRLSEDATLTLKVERRAIGRRQGGRCRKPSRRNRGARRCVRYVGVRGFGRITRRQLAGARSIRFSGRVGKRRLAAGRYRFVLQARDPSGNSSAKRTRRFTVLTVRKPA